MILKNVFWKAFVVVDGLLQKLLPRGVSEIQAVGTMASVIDVAGGQNQL